MNILFLNYCICLLLAIITYRSKVASRYITLYIFVSVFFLHAFVNINSLEDLSYYSLGFNEIKGMSITQCLTTDVEICKMERGFALILKIFDILGLSFRDFLIVNAIVVSILFYKCIISYSPCRLLSALLFLLIINNQSIYVLRQYLVVAIFLYSIKWIVNKELLKYILTCIGAFFIHQSSLILIPVYFLYQMSKKKLIMSILLFVVVLKLFLESLLMFFGDTLVGYMSYISYDEFEGQNPVAFYISLIYFILFVATLKRNIFQEGIIKLTLIGVTINCALLYLGIGFGFMGRLSIYFGALNILLVPIVVRNIKTPLFRTLIVVGCLLLNTVLTFWGAVSLEGNNYKLASLFLD